MKNIILAWEIKITCLINVTILFLHENSFIIRIAKLKNILRLLVLHSKFLGNLIRESSLECYCILGISILIFFIYAPTSIYLLILGAADCSSKYMTFSHILSCMLNWNLLLEKRFLWKKQFHDIFSMLHNFVICFMANFWFILSIPEQVLEVGLLNMAKNLDA